MTEPTVCAILLTADRPELARRAVECFRAQTYRNRFLLVWDSGIKASGIDAADDELWVRETHSPDGAIGTLRNSAVHAAFSVSRPDDIVIHFDDDDWSHPSRIAEQVALLQSSGADVVGYNEMLFWRDPMTRYTMIADTEATIHAGGEAWLYTNPNPSYCLGTSLCYWRKTWERKPFPATSFGEDLQFCTGLDRVGIGSVNHPHVSPRMIARIHAGNTSTGYRREAMEAEARKKNPVWRRVPAWDEHCRGVME